MQEKEKQFFRGISFILIGLTVVLSFALFHFFKKDYKRHCTKHSSYAPISNRQVKVENKFVIVIPSYNNEEYVATNLGSIFDQTYQNYRVIYIDDCSVDSTYDKALSFIQLREAEEKVTLIKNVKNQKALYNLFYAISSCNDDEIIVLLDGDDWLSSPYVLRDLNRYYNDENVWMTYGQYVTYPGYKLGSCRQPFFQRLERGKIRNTEYLYSHLRTFYAGLFKQIKMKDLLYEGRFFSSAWDVAIMLPMLEMARTHAVFIPEVMYVYNQDTPLNDHKLRRKEQKFFDRYIQSLEPYPALQTHPKKGFKEEAREADLFVISEDHPLQLYSFIESLKKYTLHYKNLYVYYHASNEKFAEGYRHIKEKFPEILFQKEERDNPDSFVDFLTDVLEQSSLKYISFVEDRMVVTDAIDISDATSLLEKTGAYGFCFHLGLNISSMPNDMIAVGNNCFLWQFSKGESDWASSNNLQMTLYRKSDVNNYLNFVSFCTAKDFCQKWLRGIETGGLGICYKNSRLVEIPLQLITKANDEKVVLYTEEELNDRFLEGSKIDIVPLHQIANKETRIEFYPLFVPR